MTLRARLSLLILAAVLLPLLGGIAVVLSTVPDAIRDQTTARLDASRAAAGGVLVERCRGLGSMAGSLALTASASGPASAAEDVVSRGQADYAAVLGPDGRVLADAGELPPGSLPGARTASCSRGSGSGPVVPVLAETVDVSGDADLGRAVVATALDRHAVLDLRASLSLEGQLTLASGDRLVASTLGDAAARRVVAAATSGSDSVRDGDVLVSADPSSSDRPFTVAVTAEEPTSRWLVPGITGVVVVALALAALLGWRLARDLTRPLAELTDGAERVAHGDLDAQIPVRSRDEVGRMAVAFNDMTARVRDQMGELERSRSALQASLDRVGGALARTHDLDGILDVVLDTAMSAVGAGAGAVYLGVPGGPAYVRASRGLVGGHHTQPEQVAQGVGVLGGVMASGGTARGTLGDAGMEPGPGEPAEGTVLATPLHRGGALVGVVALYGPAGGGGFTAGDQETVRSLAAQAGVAVDNVLLHEEAQRLSITDPLTGLWNFRYLSMALNRELDRAHRFDRPVAVLMLDIDHFKHVNDTYGHQRGDAVLLELARRVSEQIREVDTFARYGGEEFALVLPETDEAGASLVAERVRAAVGRSPFSAPGEPPLTVTLSIGVALFPRHGRSPATLLRAADAALYAAKGEGRDRWRLAGEPQGTASGRAPGDLGDVAESRDAPPSG